MNQSAMTHALRRLLVALSIGVSLCGVFWLLAFSLRSRDDLQYSHATLRDGLRAAGFLLLEFKTYERLSCTLWLASKGFVFGTAAAGIAGLLLGLRPGLASFLISVMNGLRAIPLTLLVPFLVVFPAICPLPPWSDEDALQRDPAVLIGLGTFLYVLIGVAEGVSSRDRERESIYRLVLGFSRLSYLRRVLFFEAMPQVLTSSRLALMLSLVLAIVFEQVLPFPGVGRQISDLMTQIAPNNANESQALGLLMIVSATGILLDTGYLLTRHMLLRWESKGV